MNQNKYWSKQEVKKRQREFIINKFSNNQTLMRRALAKSFDDYFKYNKLHYLISTLKIATEVVGIERMIRITAKFFKKGDCRTLVQAKDFQELLDKTMSKDSQEIAKKKSKLL